MPAPPHRKAREATERSPRTALVLCNGEPPTARLMRVLAREAGLVIAADGGANSALACGVVPDVIIGDLDSIRPAARRAFRASRIIRVPRQDNTDLEKALDFAVAERISHVRIAGATGGRLDFTLGNLAVLWRYAGRIDLCCVGDGWYAVPVGRRRSVRAATGTTVSLIPYGDCSGVTLRGLLYPLRNAALRIGDIAVSNVVTHSPFSVTVRAGKLLLVVLE